MTTTSTGLATAAYQELAAAPRADVITAGRSAGMTRRLGQVSQRC